jgi:hypothetical protein
MTPAATETASWDQAGPLPSIVNYHVLVELTYIGTIG